MPQRVQRVRAVVRLAFLLRHRRASSRTCALAHPFYWDEGALAVPPSLAPLGLPTRRLRQDANRKPAFFPAIRGRSHIARRVVHIRGTAGSHRPGSLADTCPDRHVPRRCEARAYQSHAVGFARRGKSLAEQSGLIHWRCDAAGHQQAPAGRTADTLTVHDGRWAYCPKDVAATGHQWKETGGVRIELLRRASPQIDLDLDIGPVANGGSPATASPRRTVSRVAGGTATRKRTTPKA